MYVYMYVCVYIYIYTYIYIYIYIMFTASQDAAKPRKRNALDVPDAAPARIGASA